MIVCYCCSRSGMPAALLALEEGGLDDVIVREVPCAGSVEQWEVLRSFRQGAEGVLIVGCLLENCAHHYGSEVAARRSLILERTVQDIGLTKGRVAMVHLAEQQSARFRRAVEEMRATIREQGGQA
ncbi:MAG TPA: hydrogenase iron-sulfur subunit [Methanomassiliicoccales archaeon]|nr:hydrogenase iron-sulfur subunit [Methanomassiliicoccales archaeon]HPR98122.1 hydrogenase iron-sulfur subunit [Methanomassiliicoccales archaeon]HSA35967.1 hydrogenase iron-sulfur subunit [Methanomassiliicoccales archaeon]